MYGNKLGGFMPTSTGIRCEVPSPVRDNSIADIQIKRMYDQVERLNNLALNLSDRLKPVCRPDSERDGRCNQTGVPEECWPPYFEELRQISRTMDHTAEILEDIHLRCEI